jgi:magnesium chelatase family protein
MDMLVHMPRPKPEALDEDGGTSSEAVLAMVLDARERQAHRLAGTGLRTNAELTPQLVRRLVRADASADRALRAAYADGTLSPRGHGRILRVARTIADLEGSARVSGEHVTVALNFRRETVVNGAAGA